MRRKRKTNVIQQIEETAQVYNSQEKLLADCSRTWENFAEHQELSNGIREEICEVNTCREDETMDVTENKCEKVYEHQTMIPSHVVKNFVKKQDIHHCNHKSPVPASMAKSQMELVAQTNTTNDLLSSKSNSKQKPFSLTCTPSNSCLVNRKFNDKNESPFLQNMINSFSDRPIDYLQDHSENIGTEPPASPRPQFQNTSYGQQHYHNHQKHNASPKENSPQQEQSKLTCRENGRMCNHRCSKSMTPLLCNCRTPHHAQKCCKPVNFQVSSPKPDHNSTFQEKLPQLTRTRADLNLNSKGSEQNKCVVFTTHKIIPCKIQDSEHSLYKFAGLAKGSYDRVASENALALPSSKQTPGAMMNHDLLNDFQPVAGNFYDNGKTSVSLSIAHCEKAPTGRIFKTEKDSEKQRTSQNPFSPYSYQCASQINIPKTDDSQTELPILEKSELNLYSANLVDSQVEKFEPSFVNVQYASPFYQKNYHSEATNNSKAKTSQMVSNSLSNLGLKSPPINKQHFFSLRKLSSGSGLTALHEDMEVSTSSGDFSQKSGLEKNEIKAALLAERRIDFDEQNYYREFNTNRNIATNCEQDMHRLNEKYENYPWSYPSGYRQCYGHDQYYHGYISDNEQSSLFRMPDRGQLTGKTTSLCDDPPQCGRGYLGPFGNNDTPANSMVSLASAATTPNDKYQHFADQQNDWSETTEHVMVKDDHTNTERKGNIAWCSGKRKEGDKDPQLQELANEHTLDSRIKSQNASQTSPSLVLNNVCKTDIDKDTTILIQAGFAERGNKHLKSPRQISSTNMTYKVDHKNGKNKLMLSHLSPAILAYIDAEDQGYQTFIPSLHTSQDLRNSKDDPKSITPHIKTTFNPHVTNEERKDENDVPSKPVTKVDDDQRILTSNTSSTSLSSSLQRDPERPSTADFSPSSIDVSAIYKDICVNQDNFASSMPINNLCSTSNQFKELSRFGERQLTAYWKEQANSWKRLAIQLLHRILVDAPNLLKLEDLSISAVNTAERTTGVIAENKTEVEQSEISDNTENRLSPLKIRRVIEIFQQASESPSPTLATESSELNNISLKISPAKTANDRKLSDSQTTCSHFIGRSSPHEMFPCQAFNESNRNYTIFHCGTAKKKEIPANLHLTEYTVGRSNLPDININGDFCPEVSTKSNTNSVCSDKEFITPNNFHSQSHTLGNSPGLNCLNQLYSQSASSRKISTESNFNFVDFDSKSENHNRNTRQLNASVTDAQESNVSRLVRQSTISGGISNVSNDDLADCEGGRINQDKLSMQCSELGDNKDSQFHSNTRSKSAHKKNKMHGCFRFVAFNRGKQR